MSAGTPPARADALRRALGEHRAPALPGRRKLRAAAVAVVLEPAEDGPRVLLIRRPVREGDRWSGDLAFPGGLAREGETLRATARREAAEEVGLTLGAPAARLRDRLAVEPRRSRPMLVRPLVYVLDGPAAIAMDPREVAEAFFFPLERIGASGVRFGRVGPLRLPAPYRPVGDRRLWGLSLRIMDELVAALGAKPR